MPEATNERGGVSQTLRKIALPAAVSVAGGAAGLLLTKGAPSGVKERLSDLGGAGADLGDDLKHKLESVIGRDHGDDGEDGDDSGSRSRSAARADTRDDSELESNRREREKRRAERRKGSG